MRGRDGESSFYLIGTLVVLIGVVVAVAKWRSNSETWQALATGGSSPYAQPRSLPLPGVIKP
jgi:hypothetical protein